MYFCHVCSQDRCLVGEIECLSRERTSIIVGKAKYRPEVRGNEKIHMGLIARI